MVATQTLGRRFEPRSISSSRLTIAVVARNEAQSTVATQNTKEELDRTLTSLADDLGLTTDSVVIHDVSELRALVEASTSSYLMVVRSGEIVAPDAPRLLCDALDGSRSLCIVHAYWVPLEKDGRVSRLRHRAHRERLRRELPASVDHRRALITQGNILQALPTFRLETLREHGGLAGATIDDALFAATLRILSRGEIRLIPRSLCGRLPECSARTGAGGFIDYCRYLAIVFRAARNGNASWLRSASYRLPGLALIGVLRHIVAPLRPAFIPGQSGLVGLVPRGLRLVFVRTVAGSSPYDLFVSAARRLPPGSFSTAGERPRTAAGPRIAYVLAHYPLLTETFIRREVEAVRSAGIEVDVLALAPGDPPTRDDRHSPAGAVTYYGPPDTERGRVLLRKSFRERPLRVIMLWLFIVRRRDHRLRRLWRDRDLLFVSAQLAGTLAERGATHVHSPSAARPALTAFVASRLIGASFSVEARASDVNRRVELPGLLDRVRHADFLVANSAFIERSLRVAAGTRPMPPIHVIHEGLDLDRFKPASPKTASQRPLHVLAVGRLAQAKGFRYLLLACDILRRRGHEFTCEIIGGPSDPEDTITWIELRRMLGELSLQDIVSFKGAATFSGVLSALARADVFALPCVTASDGSRDVTPIALMEAMAMALPAVSTRSGAIPEMMDDGVNGILVNAGDEHALAGALERLFRDPALRLQLGRAAREKVEKAFDAGTNARRLAALFASPEFR
jgi:glycosyltransferase involved in cell wall biosynthesis